MKKFALLGIFSIVLVMFASVAAANPLWDSTFVAVKPAIENGSISVSYNSSAPDNGGATFTMTGAPSGAAFTKVNNSMAILSWTPTYTQAGNYVLTLNVSDADSSDSRTVTISVADVSNPSSTDPSLAAIPAKTVSEGNLLVFNLTSTAPDFGTTNSFSRNVSTIGTLTPTSNTGATFAWVPTFTDAGVYDIRFSVADGDSSSSQVVRITVTDVPASISSTPALTLGSSTQRRSNPRADAINDREVNVSGEVTITNTGSEPLTNLSLAGVATKLGFSSSDLRVSAVFAKKSLSVGESTTASITVRVPEKLDAVDSSLVEKAFSVATLTFSANSQTGGPVTTTTDLSLQAQNQLKIRDADVKYGTKTEDINDGDTVNDLKPGDKIEITIEAENKYSNDDNLDIDDVQLTVFSDDLDLDEDDDLSSLGPKDKDTGSVSFEIDSDTDDDNFDTELRLDGRDDNGARHGERWTIQLEVNRKSHEVEVSETHFTPAIVNCKTPQAELSARIRNVGRRDEDDITLRIESPELKYGTVINKIELDQDDDTTQKFVIPLKNLTEGTYRATVETYYDFDQFSNRDVALLRVEDCSAASQTTTTPVTPPVQNEPQDNGIEVIPTTEAPIFAEPTQQQESGGFFDKPEYIALLVAANVIVLVGAIWLIGQLFSKP